MHMTTHNTNTPAVPGPMIPPIQAAGPLPAITGPARERVSELAAQVQEAQLKDQLAKIQTPGADMFRTMMEMQQKTFEMVQAMQKQNAEDRISAVKIQSDLQLEIAKLQMGKGDGESDMDQMLQFMQALPETMSMLKGTQQGQEQQQEFLLGSDNTTATAKQQTTTQTATTTPPPEQKQETPGDEGMTFDFESFKKLIRDGEISFEEAKEIWTESLPHAPKMIQIMAKKMSEADFKKRYDMIKAGQM
jgi:hypothetical protein